MAFNSSPPPKGDSAPVEAAVRHLDVDYALLKHDADEIKEVTQLEESIVGASLLYQFVSCCSSEIAHQVAMLKLIF